MLMCSLTNETALRGGKASGSGFTSEAPPERNMDKGVTPEYARDTTAASSSKEDAAVWFLMRAAYGQEAKAREILESDGIKVFLPSRIKERVTGGKKRIVRESLIPNLLFVRSTEKIMKGYIGRPGLEFFHHYYVPAKDAEGNEIGKGRKPLVIPLDQMESFIKWNDVEDEHKIFVADVPEDFLSGDTVMITEGKFKGIRGHVCRLKKQTRVGVHIDGLGTIITAYIPKAFLNKI